jgi:hypothetical protein
MSARRTADIVFCLDSSASMRPCFDAVRKNVGSLIAGLKSDGQANWDARFDFVSYSGSEDDDGQLIFGMRSLRTNGLKLIEGLYNQQSAVNCFFTSDVEEFRRGLGDLKAGGDEASFVALDTALDFPWRDAAMAHRVVILLTDEALETGVGVRQQTELIPALIEKIHRLRVMLHLVGPTSIAFDQLSAADKSEYTVVDQAHPGLANVDFAKTLAAIGKSISVSTLQTLPGIRSARRALFGQDAWTETTAPIRDE